MKYQFLNNEITSENILETTQELKEQILLENNRGQITKIFDFFNSKTSLLLATGFLGTGKTSVVKHCLKGINEDAIILWANCYESTNLDDIFLNFFEEFKRLTSIGAIKVPQAKFENFTQRISAYFYSISKPIVIVLNSYQSLIPENAQQILDFITHLSEFSKIKTIIISRNFKQENLAPNVSFEKINFKALDKELFQKYITANKIRLHGPVFEEFYKITKGYYFYTTLALIILNAKKISPLELIERHSKSFLSFREYLFSEFLTMIDASSAHLLRFLTIIRYPVNIKLLQSLNLYNEALIQLLANNYLIEFEYGNIYLKDYYKEITETEIPPNVQIKLHRACAELYEMQLPKKPEDRDLLISRKTIRQELEYHKIFIPKKVELTKSVEVYNSQAIILDSKTPMPQKTAETVQPVQETPTEILPTPQKPKELKDLLFVFEEDEENTLLSGIADSLNDFMKATLIQEQEETNLSFEELLPLIETSEKEFDYPRTISLCKKALSKCEESKPQQAYLNCKIAIANTHLNDTYTALKYFTIAQNFYRELNDENNVAETEFYIAKMNYQMFKHSKAKSILLNLNIQNNKSLEIKRNLLLFDIYLEEGNEDDAFETCKTAMKLINKAENPTTVSELLFKCGVILEARNNTLRAIEAYEKALKFNSNPKINKHLQQIYSNLTTLYAETDNIKLAQKYCQKEFDISAQNNNLEGLYNASLKLAQLYQNSDVSKIHEQYENAIKYATELKDDFYIISALLMYGDFFYGNMKIKTAFEKYLKAYQISKNNFHKENTNQIKRRILDVKYRLPEETFTKIAKEYNYEQ